jgi:hypothetical protein
LIAAVMRMKALPYQMNGCRTARCVQPSSPSSSVR